jgi:hypothetical protein
MNQIPNFKNEICKLWFCKIGKFYLKRHWIFKKKKHILKVW